MISAEQEKAIKTRFGISPDWRCLASSDRILFSMHDSGWWADNIPEATRYPSEELEDASRKDGMDVEYLAALELMSNNAMDCQAPSGYAYLVFGLQPGQKENVLVMVKLEDIRNR